MFCRFVQILGNFQPFKGIGLMFDPIYDPFGIFQASVHKLGPLKGSAKLGIYLVI